MSAVERGMLLAYCTGSARVPATGFANLMGYAGQIHHFRVHMLGGGADRLPGAATCFNTLKLHEYTSQEMLQRKLAQALLESDGFDEQAQAT